jgi:uncharacterized protein involved in exopolysaccharide biosynthesis
MEHVHVNQNANEPEADGLDLKAVVAMLLHHWYIILLGVALGLGCAWTYLRYATPVYSASTTILIREEGKSGGLGEEAILQELGLGGGNKKLENEIQLLQSRTLMTKVAETLHLGTHYIGKGRVKTSESYPNSGVSLDSIHWNNNPGSLTMRVKALDALRFELMTPDTGLIGAWSAPVLLHGDTLWFSKDKNKDLNGDNYDITTGRDAGAVAGILGRLAIKPTAKQNSSVLELTLSDIMPERAADILNTLVAAYNKEAVDDKNEVALKTLDFINRRLLLLTDELASVEGDEVSFKEKFQIPTEAEASIDMLYTEMTQYDREAAMLDIKLSLLTSLENALRDNTSELFPANIVLAEAGSLACIRTFVLLHKLQLS